MCPLEGGIAVYQARALYAIWTDEEIEDNGCGANPNHDEGEEPIASNLKVYPNPANESIHLLLPILGKDESLVVEMISGTGQLMSIHQLPDQSISYTLSTANLSNGIYVIQLKTNEQVVDTIKVIIQH